MPTLPPLFRRTAAAAALLALPLGAVVGCGQATGAKKASVEDSLQKAADHLGDSEAMQVVLRLDDTKGALKGEAVKGEDALTPDQADLVLGGTVTVTVDPADGKTVRDLQAVDPATPLADQLKLYNMAFTVQADGGSLAEVRLVGGDLYAKVGLDRIDKIAEEAGSTGLTGSLDSLGASGNPTLTQLVTDVKAGKWLKLPLVPLSDQLKALEQQQGAPTPSVDSQKLGADLLAAVRPFVSVTDAKSDGSTRTLDVKVQAKKALTAALASVSSVLAEVPGAGQFDPSVLSRLGDGTVDGQVVLKDDHFSKMTMDIGTAVRVAPPGSTPAPDLTGSLLVLDVDDSADGVSAPDDVSSADLGALVQQGLAGALGGLGGGGTVSS